MRICYFGIYDNNYIRNRNILLGLRENGAEVIEVVDRTPGPRKFLGLWKKFWPVRKDFDIMIVGFPGQIIVPFAKLLTRKPVVFDLFVSYYDSIILERKMFGVKSWKALYYYLLDWISVHVADHVMMDTQEHARYIARLLHLPAEKIITVYTGVDNKLFVPLEEIAEKKEKFIISFHGYIQILNGMDLVVRAFHEISDPQMEMWIIGGGPEYPAIQKLAMELGDDRIKFFPPMEPSQLVAKVRQADLGVGFFSQSKKIDRVIANKVYELMGLKIPVLTGFSPAVSELFQDRKNIFFCERGSISAIKTAFLELKEQSGLRKRISDDAYDFLVQNMTPKKLGERLLPILEGFIPTTKP